MQLVACQVGSYTAVLILGQTCVLLKLLHVPGQVNLDFKYWLTPDRHQTDILLCLPALILELSVQEEFYCCTAQKHTHTHTLVKSCYGLLPDVAYHDPVVAYLRMLLIHILFV